MTDGDSGEALELEGMVSAITVLKVRSADLAVLRSALRDKLAAMPDLFDAALIALDLCGIDGHPDEVAARAAEGEAPALAPITLEAIVGALRQERFTPVAVRNLRQERVEEAKRLGLGRVRSTAPRATRKRRPQPKAAVEQRTEPAGEQRTEPAGEQRTEPAGEQVTAADAQALATPGLVSPSLTVHQPIRGGQVVYAKGADAVALAPVNAGGELIADGNIHIYAPLRGRALAGAHGDADARIFCTSLQAELVSVAGVYLHAEELPDSHRGKPAQIYLDGDTLVVTDL